MAGFFNVMKSQKARKEAKSLYESSQSSKMFETVNEHRSTSWDDVVSPQTEGWKEKESMLIGKSYDQITGKETNSGVYDPRIATIAFERVGRVMSQNPSGKSLAMSKDDRGKNMLMNLLMDKWVLPNANSQFSFLIKSRLFDLYSLMYGTMFGLVDSVNNDNYSGADFWILPIRNCRPQANRFSIQSMDHFGVSTYVTQEWIAKRNRDTWKNIDKLLLLAKDAQSKVAGDDNENKRSLIEQAGQPTTSHSKDFKTIELYTEYRKDRWITIAPDFPEVGVLRDIANPHEDDELPIVAKHAFPLIDSIYGLGEFERGKTLQFALNSLWNLYLDGVKMSIFPPIQMVAEDVVPSTIKLEPAAKWLLTKEGAKIENFNVSPQGINTFQSTYGYLVGAILNMAGTTDTTISQSTDQALGKTPQALKLQASRESTRDAWDRFMMEETLEDMMTKFVNITAKNLDKDVELRLFANEIKEIQSVYPDVVDLVDGAERGTVTVKKGYFKDTKFDYQIVKGSTYQADKQQEQENITGLLNFTIQNYQLLEQSENKKGKTIDLGELYDRSLVVSGVQDWDKIVRDIPATDQGMGGVQGQSMNPGMAQGMIPGQEQMQGQTPQGQVPNMQPQVSVGGSPNSPINSQFKDPAIQEFAKRYLNG